MATLPYPCTILVPDVDEDLYLDRDPATYVQHTAKQKAEAVAEQLPVSSLDRVIVVAADTTVTLDGEILGKPTNEGEARVMLAKLSNRTHEVHTGLCLVDVASRCERLSVHTAAVTMRNYSPAEIDQYVATGDPMDKAGAYAIQHSVFRPVARLEGCYLAVMGLSICELVYQLAQFDFPVRFDKVSLTDAHQGYACPALNRIEPVI